MSKGLAALEDIRQAETQYQGTRFGEIWNEELSIIEKDLEVLEIIRNKPISASNCIMILKSRFDNLSYEDYTQLFLTDLTKEEYDLLKEVLCS